MEVQPAVAAVAVHANQQVVAAGLQFDQDTILKRQRSPRRFVHPDFLAVVPDLYAVAGADQQENLLAVDALQARVGVARRRLLFAEQFRKGIKAVARRFLPGQLRAFDFVGRAQLYGGLLRCVDRVEAFLPVVERTDDPSFLDFLHRRVGQTACATFLAQLCDRRLSARVVEQVEEVGRLEPHRFVLVGQQCGQQGEQFFLFVAVLAGLPVFGDGKAADAAVLLQVDLGVGELDDIHLLRR